MLTLRLLTLTCSQVSRELQNLPIPFHSRLLALGRAGEAGWEMKEEHGQERGGDTA